MAQSIEFHIGGERFEIELHDSLKDRSLKHEYAIRSLAIAD
jgi:hypothetical protein